MSTQPVILGPDGKPWRKPKPAKRWVRAKYDSAQTTENNRRHWAGADGLSAAAANSPHVRKILRQRARYETDNNGYAEGLIHQLAVDLIGVGPRLQISSGDREYDRLVEESFTEWAEADLLWIKLNTMAESKKRDGEAFATFEVNDQLPTAVKLSINDLECDHFADPHEFSFDSRRNDGITYDQQNRPLTYNVLLEHPGDTFNSFSLQSQVYPASRVIHWFRRFRSGQLRGVPEVKSSLEVYAMMRRYMLAVLQAAENAASFSVLLETEAAPEPDEEEAAPDPFETLEIERGLMTTLPAGAKMSQLDAEQPTATYPDYVNMLIRQTGRPVGAPFNINSGDSSNYNFSGARLDRMIYASILRVEREQCRLEVLNRIYREWAKEAFLAGQIPAAPGGSRPEEIRLKWQWPGMRHIQPREEAEAATENLNNKTATLSSILAEQGIDWEDHLEQVAREQERLRELGLNQHQVVAPSQRNTNTPTASASVPTIGIAANGGPALVQIVGDSGQLELEAADASKPNLRRFNMTAYTGGVMRLAGLFSPVVVDLSGLNVNRQAGPILRDHDPSKIVGHHESVNVSQQRLRLSGVLSGTGEAAEEVRSTAANGFPWQASIGASVERQEFVEAGASVNVNGKRFQGPLVVVRAATLREVSFVPVGADPGTSVAVANQGTIMTFEQWLAANGFDQSQLTSAQLSVLRAAFSQQQPAPQQQPQQQQPQQQPPQQQQPAPQQQPQQQQPQQQQPQQFANAGNLPQQPQPQQQPAPQPQHMPSPAMQTLEQVAAQARERREREGQIANLSAQYIGEHPSFLDDIQAMAEAAIRDQSSPNQFELNVLRHVRSGPRPISTSRGQDFPEAPIVEAALARAARLPNLEKNYRSEILEASERHWRHGIGLQEILMTYAHRNGYRAMSRQVNAEVMRFAFMRGSDLQAGMASPSLHSLSGVLSNVMNKFLRESFLSVDQAWRMISAVATVSDFKQKTNYSLTGDMTFKKVGPGGEIKHGTMGAESYTNQAETYARMIGIDRRDIINDDLGAFGQMGRRMGRGGALALNEIFWTEFLDNSTFFTAGNGSAFTGAGTALSLSSLDDANENFHNQTDPDGNPLGIMPAILLVPTPLQVTGWNLVNSLETRPAATGAGNTAEVTQSTTANFFRGRYMPVSSPYMSNSNYTGNSSTAWYLLADPNDMPVIETAFLNGVESPTVEQADADLNILGVAFRGFFDFGVNKQEYRGGVRMAGA